MSGRLVHLRVKLILATLAFVVFGPVRAEAEVTVHIQSYVGAEQKGDDIRGCDNRYDAETLVVRRDGRQIVAQDYCSSYGFTSAKVVTDRRNVAYVVLEFGDGRGTGARTEHLAVFRVGNGLAICTRQVIGGAAGVNSGWTYKYDFERPTGGGLRLSLRREIGGDDPAYYPRVEAKVVEIDTAGNACAGPDLKRQKITGNGINEYPKGDDDYDAAPASHPLGRLNAK